MKSHELAEKLLKLPNVDVRLSTEMSQKTFELCDILNIYESELVRSILPDKLFKGKNLIY